MKSLELITDQSTYPLNGLYPGSCVTRMEKPSFFYRNSLLNCKKYTKKMKKCVRSTLISEYLRLGGTVPKDQIQKILTKDLQYLFINREKNGARFSFIDVWYQIYEKVEEMQCLFLKQRNRKEYSDENSFLKELNSLESLDCPSRNQQRRRNALRRALSDMQAMKLRRRAEDASLDFHSLGESGSRFFNMFTIFP